VIYLLGASFLYLVVLTMTKIHTGCDTDWFSPPVWYLEELERRTPEQKERDAYYVNLDHDCQDLIGECRHKPKNVV